MNIEIRYATEVDCEALSEVIATIIQHIPYYNELAKKTEVLKFAPENLVLKIREDKFSVILAVADNHIIGFCLSRFDDYVIWLEWFGVLQDYRKRKISGLLLKALETTVAPRNCHKIWCDCRTENLASIHILTKQGYKQLVVLSNHWYGQDFILWEKSI